MKESVVRGGIGITITGRLNHSTTCRSPNHIVLEALFKEVRMTMKQAIEHFRSHQQAHVRQKTQNSYRYLIHNFETLFGDSLVEAISSEDIYQFLLIVTEGRAKSSARLRYAQIKALFNYLVERQAVRVNPCEDPVLRRSFKAPRRKDRDIIAREILDEVIYRCKKQRDRLILELQARCGLRIG